MTLRPAAFAIPGDINTLTGGYIYERHLLAGLRAQGRDVAHIELGSSFPNPTQGDMEDAEMRLTAVDPDRPVILDGLVFGSIDTGLLNRMAAPIVAMIHHPLAHESGLDAAWRDHLYRTERDNLSHAAHVLVPSPHTAALLSSDYGVSSDRITIARPGTVQPNVQTAPTDPPLILSVGIQHPRKGHDILLRALALLADRDWQAVIVGGRYDTAHAAELEQLHAQLGLAGRVRFAGRVDEGALAWLYGQAAIFALATRYEGYGIVFDEAMAHGLPIVSCQTGAVPDTVAEGAGMLVEPENPEAFADALGELLVDRGLRAQMATAAGRAGAALLGWGHAAQVAGVVLDQILSDSLSGSAQPC
jgi:glycosyltransferase involved in cell wall biosynthesis